MKTITLRDLTVLVNGNIRALAGVLEDLLPGYERWHNEGDTFLTSRDRGVEVLATSSGEVNSLFLFAEGTDDSKQYQGELPADLSFGLGRQEVRRRLGEPNQAGDARVYLGRQVHPWDKFDLPAFSLRVTYALDEGSIQQLTLARRDRAG